MIKQHKVVSALPAPLEADSVYFVRVGAGFDVVVTNGAGTIVPYELNAKSALAQKAASGINADITNLTALNSILALPLGLSFNANTKIYPESNGMKIQLGSPTSATGYITIKSTGELVLESAGLTVGGSLLPKATTMLLGNTAFPWSQAYIKTLMMTGPMNGAAAVTVASAATVDLGAASVTSNSVVISGTTTITSFGTGASAPIGAERNVRFSGNLTLTHSANLILPGAAPIITAAGDCATFQYVAAGVWRCTAYLRADGKSLALGTPVFPGDFGLGDHMKFTENATAGTQCQTSWGTGSLHVLTSAHRIGSPMGVGVRIPWVSLCRVQPLSDCKWQQATGRTRCTIEFGGLPRFLIGAKFSITQTSWGSSGGAAALLLGPSLRQDRTLAATMSNLQMVRSYAESRPQRRTLRGAHSVAGLYLLTLT